MSIPDFTSPDTLIVVCCHAIYLGAPHDPRLEDSWLIEPFQSGEIPTFISHIEAGVQQLRKYGKRAMLVLSGGRTKRDRTERSEAESYVEVAREMGLIAELGNGLEDRVFCDEWATDSFQNVMCSLMQWPLWIRKLRSRYQSSIAVEGSKLDADVLSSGRHIDVPWPTRLIIISHEFKRQRFEGLHLPALKWNAEVEYIGIDPPFDEKKMAEIVEGDGLRGYGVWNGDIYGQGEVLADKRGKRGWDERQFIREVIGHELRDEAREKMNQFVRWKGGMDSLMIFPDMMPWEIRTP